MRVRAIAVSFVLLMSHAALLAQAPSKYKGPRPAKPDLPYLLHASNLVETEPGEAREEQRKDEIANIMKGAASPARTPLAEPIFLLNAEKLVPEKLELYRTIVKAGNREVTVPKNPKKAKDAAKPLRLSVTKLDTTLFRLEATEALDNGEYCLSPSGSQQVFCFQVF
jgi:hypothetical protein